MLTGYSSVPDLISSSVTPEKEPADCTECSGYSEHDAASYRLSGTIYPFQRQPTSLWNVVVREFSKLMKEKEAKKIALFLVVNILGTFVLLLWCHTSNSMALTAFTYLTIFDIFSLLTCILSVWVEHQIPTPAYSFGYERFEVLAVFASTMLAQLGSFFIIKESVERSLQQPEVHTGRLLIGTCFAFVLHMVITYSINNKAMNHVINASSSSWLQEHMTDMSESLCHVVPGLSKLLLPRMNPFALIAYAGGVALIITYILIDTKNYLGADTMAAMCIAVMTCGTLFPMSIYTGKILLQTTPSHIISQLDKLLREASTLDGVLEFRHEHFWTLSFGKLAGSVQVRVRRDADEQMVLAHVHNRLANLVCGLTVHIFKDDWTRGTTYQMFASPGIQQLSTAGFASQFSTNNPFNSPPLGGGYKTVSSPPPLASSPSGGIPGSNLYRGSGVATMNPDGISAMSRDTVTVGSLFKGSASSLQTSAFAAYSDKHAYSAPGGFHSDLLKH